MRAMRLDGDGQQWGVPTATALSWEPLERYGDVPVTGVEVAALWGRGDTQALAVRFAPGAHFPMHAASVRAFVQIISGEGTMAVPDADAVTFGAGDLFVFPPGMEHEWRDITQPCELFVCEISDG